MNGISLPRLSRVASLPLTVAALVLAGCAVDNSTAPLRSAAGARAASDYGPGAVYQVEISSNITGKNGGGIWLWIELNADGTGDYSGSDCGRGSAERATSDRGEITSWSIADGVLTINGVKLNGFGGLPVTITVPLPASGYGHVTTDVISIFPALATVLGLPPGVGFSQVQVAP
jgi:hypothetical protein